MNLRSFSVWFLILMASLNCDAGRVRKLEGCLDPDTIATALAKLHHAYWRDLSLADVRSIWRTELGDNGCTLGGCSGVWSMDRMINGGCECCDSFMFNIQGTEAQPRTEWLGDITITYSSPNRAELLAAAKKLAVAVGLSDSELKTVGKGHSQFLWQTKGRNGPELSWFMLDFGQSQFTLHFTQNRPM